MTGQKNVQCKPKGMFGALGSCVPINDCVGHTCGPFGFCADQHMNYTCDCLEGYESHLISDDDGMQELVCGDINDCHGAQCGEGGTCEDQVGEYSCNCRAGFEQVEVTAEHETCERVECGVPPTI